MHFNISRLIEFMRCPQKYNYRYEENLAPLGESSEARDFGTKIHAGLQRWYETKSLGEAIAAFTGCEPVDHPMRGYGQVMLQDYVKRFKGEDESMRVVAVEQELSAPLMGHTLHGRMDLVVEKIDARGQPRLWHVQHKTLGHSVGMENYVQQYDLAWHERAYYILGHANGLPIEGTILSMLRKTKIPSFLRIQIPMTIDLVERFKTDVFHVMKQVEDKLYRPQNPDACWNYQQMCPFQPLCLNIPLDPDHFGVREADYVDEARRLGA